MKRLATVGFAFISAICLSFHAQAQRTAVYTWTCNIEGAPAQLTAQVEAINSAGVFVDSSGMFAGAIGTGEVNYYYQGRLVSATAQYVFTGQNQFADFTDLGTQARFRVQFIAQGPMLLLIANPEGPQPARYGCQMSGQPK